MHANWNTSYEIRRADRENTGFIYWQLKVTDLSHLTQMWDVVYKKYNY